MNKQFVAQGMSPEAAAKRTAAMMAGEAPGRIPTAIADVSYNMKEIKHEGKRLAKTVKKAPGAIVRRARDGYRAER